MPGKETYYADPDVEGGQYRYTISRTALGKKRQQDIRRLLTEKDKMDQSLHKFQLMMLYGFCITSLEAYLSDVFAKRENR